MFCSVEQRWIKLCHFNQMRSSVGPTRKTFESIHILKYTFICQFRFLKNFTEDSDPTFPTSRMLWLLISFLNLASLALACAQTPSTKKWIEESGYRIVVPKSLNLFSRNYWVNETMGRPVIWDLENYRKHWKCNWWVIGLWVASTPSSTSSFTDNVIIY